jgi:hypothetical protein
MIDDSLKIEEDSPDLSDVEIEGAQEAQDARDLANYVKLLCCTSCGRQMAIKAHQLRRRKPDLFSRVTLECLGCSGETKVLFKITSWLRREQ